MKPTAVLLTVLFVGCSFGTKDKTVTATNDGDLIIPKVSLTKADTAPSSSLASSSSPKPGYKQAASPKPAQFELLKPYVDSALYEYSIACMPAIGKEEDSNNVKEDDKILGCVLESEAEYPGGTAAWQRFLSKNLKFPTDSSGNGIEGTVVVKFFIDEAGNVCDVEAVRGPMVLGAEAVRVIKKSRTWTPAKRYSNDRPIKSYKTQPVIFHF